MTTNVLSQTETQFANLALTVVALVSETDLREQPFGVPSGPMYAAFMAKGYTLEQYSRLTEGLAAMGLIRKSGNCFFPTTKGKQWAASLQGVQG